MKVLHVHRAYLPYGGGSARRISSLLEAGVAFEGYEQHVLVTRNGVPASSPDEEVIRGIRVFRLDDWRRIPLRARALHRAHGYDVLHFHSPRDLFFCAGFLRGIPRVVESHGVSEMGRVKRWLANASFRAADRVVVLSEAAREWLSADAGLDSARVHVVANGIDYDRFLEPGEVAAPLPLAAAPGKLVGYVGTMYAWQGIFALADAFACALGRDPDLRLLYVGDGPDLARLREHVDGLGVGDRVGFVGHVPPAAAAAYLRAIDLFAMLRPAERLTDLATPLKIFEVGVSGTPLVVSPRPALLEVGGERPEDHFFVQEDLSAQAAGARLAALLAPAMRAERSGRARAFRARLLASDASWTARARQLREIYRLVTGR